MPHLENLKRDWEKILSDFAEIFEDKVGELNGFTAEIVLKSGATPVACACPRWTPAVRTLMLEAITKLKERGLVEPASQNCPWASRWHCVVKNREWKISKLRWVSDLR